MYLTLLLFVVFIACLAMLIREGLWSNAIMFFNILLAATLATNYFEPLAGKFESWLGTPWRYVTDFLALWALFSGVLIILRVVTDKLSRTNVRFKLPVEWAGGIFFACWVGWLMVCFTTFTLHTAPLVRTPFDGSFQEKPDSEMFLGLAPDRKWLAFMHTMSDYGSLSKSHPEGDISTVFDPNAEFIVKYSDRRAQFEKEKPFGSTLLVPDVKPAK